MAIHWNGFFSTLLILTVVSCTDSVEEPVSADRYAAWRTEMVRTQLSGVGREGVQREDILAAMATVERHRFVPTAMRRFSYADRPLPIGHGQTISQPYIVALMTALLDPNKSDRVLEIGTGSGYQAAVLAKLVKEVFTIEIVEPLGKRAASTLEDLGYQNVHVRIGDGYEGWPDEAPFDAIIVTCAPDHVPKPLTDQLKEGGRLVIPVGEQWGAQDLYLLEKRDGQLKKKLVIPVRFVPMTGAGREEENR